MLSFLLNALLSIHHTGGTGPVSVGLAFGLFVASLAYGLRR